MRPAYLTPKLTDTNRVEIRRLRGENPKAWTLHKLAARFGVHRSTVSHVLKKRMRASVEQELAAMRFAAETSDPIQAEELMRLKHQEWSRLLLSERDLGRQQQLVNLIKSVAPLLDAVKAREHEYRPTAQKDIEKACEALREAVEERARAGDEEAAALLAEYDAEHGSKPTMPQFAFAAASEG